MEENFFNKKFVYAVVGASNNREKYGFKVFKDLKDSGFKVIPINPHEKYILGVKVYKSLSSIKERVDVVVTVVPPKITEEIVKECFKLGINKVWMQPGSEDKEAIDFCRKHNIIAIYNTCIMVENHREDKFFI